MHVPIKMRSCVHERFALVQQKESRALEAFAFLVDKRTAFASSKKKVVIVSGCVIDFIVLTVFEECERVMLRIFGVILVFRRI